jgi:hypothetical protein
MSEMNAETVMTSFAAYDTSTLYTSCIVFGGSGFDWHFNGCSEKFEIIVTAASTKVKRKVVPVLN